MRVQQGSVNVAIPTWKCDFAKHTNNSLGAAMKASNKPEEQMYPALGEALSAFLTKLYVKLALDRNTLANQLKRNRATVAGWETGHHRPNFGDMYALLDLNAQHEIIGPRLTIKLFRLWLDAWGWENPNVVDLITGRRASDALRIRNTEYQLLAKELAWSRLIRELESLISEMKQGHHKLAQQVQSDPSSLEQYEDWVKWALELMLQRVCTFYCTLYGDDSLVTRATIYTPTQREPHFLAIKWQRGLRQDSLRFDHWYCGPGDPPDGKYLGFVGHIYRNGIGEAIANVFEDKESRFKDLWQPPRSREQIEYYSLVKTPIQSKSQHKFGVLGFDSQRYVFTRQDLVFVDEMAIMLGQLFEETGLRYKVDYTPPAINPFGYGSSTLLRPGS